MKNYLPIQLVPDTTPPQFEYNQVVATLAGVKAVRHKGLVPVAMESALKELIELAAHLDQENERLSKENDELRAKMFRTNKLEAKK